MDVDALRHKLGKEMLKKHCGITDYYWSNGDQAEPSANEGVPITATGGGNPFDIMPPYLGVNFIIKL